MVLRQACHGPTVKEARHVCCHGWKNRETLPRQTSPDPGGEEFRGKWCRRRWEEKYPRAEGDQRTIRREAKRVGCSTAFRAMGGAGQSRTSGRRLSKLTPPSPKAYGELLEMGRAGELLFTPIPPRNRTGNRAGRRRRAFGFSTSHVINAPGDTRGKELPLAERDRTCERGTGKLPGRQTKGSEQQKTQQRPIREREDGTRNRCIAGARTACAWLNAPFAGRFR